MSNTSTLTPPAPPASQPSLELHAVLQELTTISQTPASQLTLEQQLLTPKLMRALYKLVPAPTPNEFPDIFEAVESNNPAFFQKRRGYTTTAPDSILPSQIQARNTSPLYSRVHRMSSTKARIAAHYAQHGWYAVVSAYNVTVSKIVPHPTIPSLAVLFINSRDSATYEFMLLCQENT